MLKIFANKGETDTIPINAENLNYNFNEVINLVYPVGSIYISVNSTNPANLFGGTWEQLKGRFLLGVGSPNDNTDNHFGSIGEKTYSAGAGSLGGSSQNRYQLDDAGYAKIALRNTGSIDSQEVNTGSWTPNYRVNATSATTTVVEAYSGPALGGTTGLGYNMPPYIGVYMWKRVE